MKWIRCTVYEIYCDLETGVRGHSRSPKVALFDSAHTTLCPSPVVNMSLSIIVSENNVAAYWSKIAIPLYSAPPLGVKPSDLRNNPRWRKTRMMGLSDSQRMSMTCSIVRRFSYNARVWQTDGQTDGRTDGIVVSPYHIYTHSLTHCCA